MWKKIVFNLEGYPWGAVRDLENDSGAEKKIQEYLKKSPDDIMRKLKDVLNMYHRQTLDVETLKNLKKDIDDFLEKETEEERERGHSRIGTRKNDANSRSQSTIRHRETANSLIYCDDPTAETDVPIFE
uniref:Uncharacterized protein n=1 Tax=Caenorhabditis tropicalis TaxID=1561998 RepID=A0A1I7UWU2_9PELO